LFPVVWLPKSVMTGDQLAGGERRQMLRRKTRVHHTHFVGAQEHLVRGVGRVGLVLIDERRGRVGRLERIVGGIENAIRAGGMHRRRARQDHEIVGAGGPVVQRVIRHQRDEHHLRGALGDEVQPMVEELPKERHPGIERHGQAEIRLHVGNEIDQLVIGRAKQAVEARACRDRRSGISRRRSHGGWIAGGLINDQIRNDAWLRIPPRTECPAGNRAKTPAWSDGEIGYRQRQIRSGCTQDY
jgi:hypothetical protein